MFIYPDNLKAKATLWLWELRDVAIIGVGFLFSVLAIAQTGILLPLVVTVLFSSLSWPSPRRASCFLWWSPSSMPF